ncbi:COR domain-containing protein [uncultured Aquimarina sp.]|uniref:COR domain-containing protein n=1 Tax=uncultured Aquimarina sp. TaxID=575652 RepID=UPI00260BDA7E|nr:COR domain-containing protein [uncultured Aquimarina sp.]
MRELNKSEQSKLEYFKTLNIPFAQIEVTQTALEKSILDATQTIRDLLLYLQLHDYDKQKFGADFKESIPTNFLLEDEVFITKSQLYRSNTRGDKRIWFEQIKSHISGADILILFGRRDQLYLINITQSRIRELANSSKDNPIRETINQYKNGFQDSNVVFNIENPIHKLSHGSLFTYEQVRDFQQRKIAVIHKDTKAKGKRPYTQAEDFKHAQIGDYFYLCNANYSVNTIGSFSSEWEMCEIEDLANIGWIQRKYIVHYNAIQIKPYNRKIRRWWLPTDFSTFVRIPIEQMKEANEILFIPHFDVKVQLSFTDEIDSEYMHKSLIKNDLIGEYDINDNDKITTLKIINPINSGLGFLRRFRDLKLLDISNTEISNIGIIRDLPQLTTLILSKNNISDLSPIRHLHNLRHLDLRNNEISDIKELTVNKMRKLSVLKLSGNQKLKLPLSDFDDLNGIIGFKISIDEGGLEENKHVKVNIIGTERIGKTQLFNVLLGNLFVHDHVSTHGTKTTEYKVGNSGYSALLWDFGGQSYHHGTHKIFLRPYDINIILWRDSIGKDNYPYWLGTVKRFGNSSPQLMIQNVWENENDEIIFPKSEKAHLYDLPFHNTFAIDISEFLNKSSKWEPTVNNFIKRFQHLIKEHASKFKDLSKKNVSVRKKLDKETNPEKIYWDINEFKDNYASSFSNEEFAYLLNYLEYTGRILHFRESEELKSFVFSNPPSLSDWIYNKVLTKVQMQNNNGVVDYNDLKDLLKEEAAELFINLMTKFGLIFQSPFSDSFKKFIVPQFLPENNSALKNTLLDVLPYTFCIRFEDFLHEGAVFNFISKYGKEAIDESSIWKYGLIFKNLNYNVQVLMHFNRESQEVIFHIENGNSLTKFSQELFDFFVDGGEDSINGDRGDYQNVSLSTDNSCFFDIKGTKINISEGVFYGECIQTKVKRKLNSLEMSLLDRSSKVKNVFISYSRKDVDYKDELRVHLAPLVRYDTITEWACEDIRAGKWDEQIQTKLQEADLIIYMVSANFMASDYIIDNEVKIGIEMAINDPSKKIMCILVKECVWRSWALLEKNFKETNSADLSQFQFLPYHKKNGEEKILSLEEWGAEDTKPRSVAYRDIVGKILNEVINN